MQLWNKQEKQLHKLQVEVLIWQEQEIHREDELEEELNALEMVDIPVAPSDTPQPITTPPPTQACRHRSDLPLQMLSQ